MIILLILRNLIFISTNHQFDLYKFQSFIRFHNFFLKYDNNYIIIEKLKFIIYFKPLLKNQFFHLFRLKIVSFI
jgi:hypothetical protein